MKIARLLLAQLLMAALAIPASAIDFGADLGDSTAFSGSGDNSKLSQENTAAAWISLPIGSYSSLYASAILGYSGTFILSPSGAENDPGAVTFTAGKVEWEGFIGLSPNSSLRWSLGRVPFQDYSGRILSGTFDGGLVELSLGRVQLSASGAYTGLTFKDSARVLIDADDAAIWSDDTRQLAPGRVLASLNARFVELIPMHDFGVEGLAQFDLEAAGAKTNTQYLEPFIEGRIGRELRWRLWGAAAFGQDAEQFYGLAAGGRMRLALPEVMGLRLTAAATWAGGDHDADGAMRAFATMTAGSIATITGTTFSDASALSIDGSISPLRGLSTGAAGAVVIRPGALTPYLGSEVSLRLSYRPVNDLGLSAVGGVYVPNMTIDAEAKNYWSLSISAALRL